MSLNDPGWGNNRKGGKQGPPDLDELWQDLTRQLSALFGKKGGARGANAPQTPPGKPPIQGLKLRGGKGLALLGLALLIWLASGFYIVDASQRGIVLTFGSFHEVTGPGPRWRLPYPIQSNEIVELTDVRVVEVGYRGSDKNKVLKEALMLTNDENIINIQFAVQWYISDPKAYLFNNRSVDDTVLQAAETAMREVVGKSKMDFVLYEGREHVAASASKLMQETLDLYKTGIIISHLSLQNVQPPEQVQAAFDDAVKAGQDRDRQINEGQAYANDVIPRARGAASRLMAEANGYEQRIIATAEGDASRFKQILVEYKKSPEVMRQRLYLETVEKMLSNTTKVLLDAKGGGNLLYLPLDKLMQAASVGSAAATTQSGLATVPQLAPGDAKSEKSDLDIRSRDTLRSRERGDR